MMLSFEEVWSNRRRDVECVARLILRRSGHWEMFDELVAAGMVGLYEACRNYDPSKMGMKSFWLGYARHRVRGAMIDELRAMDHVKRDGRQAIAAGGEDAVPAWCLVRKAAIDDVGEVASGEDVEAKLLERTDHSLLRAAVGELPERLRDVVLWYYYEGEMLGEIGRRLGVTEGRACQLKHEALRTLRVSLRACEVCGGLHAAGDRTVCEGSSVV